MKTVYDTSLAQDGSLPMWQEYGNHGKGMAFVFDAQRLAGLDESNIKDPADSHLRKRIEVSPVSYLTVEGLVQILDQIQKNTTQKTVASLLPKSIEVDFSGIPYRYGR